MAIKRVSLSWVNVSSLEKTRAFFVDTLGLNVFEKHEEFGWMELQGKQGGVVMGTGVVNPNSDERPGTNAVITFVVDDYQKTVKELKQKGIEFFDEMAGVPGIPRMISFKDPDGNHFQLVEETPGETDKI